jgi:hypothetical protein
MDLDDVRGMLKIFGGFPLLLLMIGAVLVVRGARYGWAFAGVGFALGAWNTLYTSRQINATVTAGDATVTWTEGSGTL